MRIGAAKKESNWVVVSVDPGLGAEMFAPVCMIRVAMPA